MHFPRKVIGACTVLIMALGLSACGGEPKGGVNSFDLNSITADPEIVAMVPGANRESLSVALEIPYPPSVFFDSKNQPVGYEVDVLNALAKVMGVKSVKINNVDFDNILKEVGKGTYDLGASALTVNKERMKTLNMVSYVQLGFLYGTQKGNPRNFDHVAPCGFKVGVAAETDQENYLQSVSQQCLSEGKPAVDIVSDKDQDKLINQVNDGSLDAILAESATVKYAETNHDKFVAAGESFMMAPQGIVTSKTNPALAKAVAAGMQKLIDKGIMKKVLKPWGLDSFVLNYATLNPPLV